MGKASDSKKYRKHSAKEAARKAAKFRVIDTKPDSPSDVRERRQREVANSGAPIILESLRVDDLGALKVVSRALEANGLTLFMVRTTDEPNDFFGIWELACLAGAGNCAVWIAEKIYEECDVELKKRFLTKLFSRCEDVSIAESSQQFQVIKASWKLFYRAALVSGRNHVLTAVLNNGVVPRSHAIWLEMVAEHEAQIEHADLDAMIFKPAPSHSMSARL